MKATQKTPKDIDEYIAGFPKETQKVMERIRATIKKAAPGMEEKISYKMPAFMLKGYYLVAIAAYKRHIGLYPAPRGIAQFKKELAKYGSGKSTLKFSLDEPIPYGLIARIVKFRVKENKLKPPKIKKI